MAPRTQEGVYRRLTINAGDLIMALIPMGNRSFLSEDLRKGEDPRLIDGRPLVSGPPAIGGVGGQRQFPRLARVELLG